MHWSNAFVIVRQQPQCFDALLIFKRICYWAKTDSVGRTHVAIYMCTKFLVRLCTKKTNTSVRSWHILYVNYVLQYVYGNADYHSPMKSNHAFVRLMVIYSSAILVAVTSEWSVKRVICKTCTGALANNADPDQMQQNAASDQGLHCLLKLHVVKG